MYCPDLAIVSAIHKMNLHTFTSTVNKYYVIQIYSSAYDVVWSRKPPGTERRLSWEQWAEAEQLWESRGGRRARERSSVASSCSRRDHSRSSWRTSAVLSHLPASQVPANAHRSTFHWPIQWGIKNTKKLFKKNKEHAPLWTRLSDPRSWSILKY